MDFRRRRRMGVMTGACRICLTCLRWRRRSYALARVRHACTTFVGWRRRRRREEIVERVRVVRKSHRDPQPRPICRRASSAEYKYDSLTKTIIKLLLIYYGFSRTRPLLIKITSIDKIKPIVIIIINPLLLLCFVANHNIIIIIITVMIFPYDNKFVSIVGANSSRGGQ